LTGGSETINLGGGFAVASAGAGNFRIAGVNEGTHDLVVWGLAGPATRAVIRRDLNIPDNGTVGTVDLTSEESFAAVSNVLSVQGGAAGEAFSYSLNYLTTPACTVNQLGNTATFFGVPSSVQRPDDFHMHTVTASTSTRSRSVTNVYHLATNRVANLPPVFTAPVISAVAGSYKRLRAFFPADIPTPYNTGITLRYSNGAKLMFVSASLGYTSTSAVNILMPDLGAVSGFPFTYAIPSDFSGQWSVYIEGATGTQLCTEGLQKVLMTHAGVF
jgi:hypothetical protein